MSSFVLSFIKNAVKLMSGTGFAQILPIIFLPVLSRIYSPGDFAGFVVFVALLSVFSVIANFRLQLAIVQPDDDRDAVLILYASLMSGFLMCLFSGFVLFLFKSSGEITFKNEDMNIVILILSLSILASSVQQATSYWLLRFEQFTTMAISKVIQGGITISAQIVLGMIFASYLSLIFGYFLGILASSSFMVYRALVTSNVLVNFSINELATAVARVKVFPLLSTPAALLNSVSLQMGIYGFTRFQSVASTGAFGLTMRVLSVPSSLVAMSVSQVLLKASADKDARKGIDFHLFVALIFSFLFVSYLPLALIVSVFGEEVFTFVFGAQWAEAGLFAEIIVWGVLMQFAVSPISSILTLKKYLNRGIAWQVLHFISLCLVVYFFAHQSATQFIKFLVINEIIFYFLYLVLILVSAKQLQEEAL